MISKDNVSVRVNAVLSFRVVAPENAIIQVENYYEATSQLAQTTLRSVELDEMLSERERLNSDVQKTWIHKLIIGVSKFPMLKLSALI